MGFKMSGWSAFTKTIAKDKKPDFLDLDGDGNKKEAMENAAKNIKEQTPNVASNLTKTIAKDKPFNEKTGKNKVDITKEPKNTPEIEKMLTTYENLENKQNKTQEEINKMKMLKEKLDTFYKDDNPS
jgi:hypothetical protein